MVSCVDVSVGVDVNTHSIFTTITTIITTTITTTTGDISSGGFGPTFGKPVAMGYVTPDMAKEGTEVSVKVRNKFLPCTVTKMPFVDTNYFRVE